MGQVDEVTLLTTRSYLGAPSLIRHGSRRLSDFVRRNVAVLASRPVWLFSVSSVGDHGSFVSPSVARLFRKMRSENKDVAAFRVMVHPRDHRGFAGAIERGHWSLPGHLFLTVLGGHYGDHRDWNEIDEWAGTIAVQLRSNDQTGVV